MKQANNLNKIIDHLTDLLFRTWSAFLVAKNLDPIIESKNPGQKNYFFISAYFCSVESTLLGFSKLMSTKKDELGISYLFNYKNIESSALTKEHKQKLKKHKQKLKILRPLIQQVKTWRDKAIAHLDKNYIFDPATLGKMQPVNMEDVSNGLIILQDILNEYRDCLNMELLRLEIAESKMTNEWNDIAALIKGNKKQ